MTEAVVLAAGRMEVSVKKSKWLLIAGLVIMMMAIGCKRMGDQVDIAATEAAPMVLPLVMGPSEVLIGHVYVWDDDVDLFVKCTLDVAPPPGVEFRLIKIEFDVQLDSTQFPWTSDIPQHINTSLFGYRLDPVPYPYQGWRIPGIGAWTGSAVVATMHCVVLSNLYDPVNWGKYAAWAKDPNHPFAWADPDCHGWWFPYRPAPPGDWHAMTAWGGHAMPEWYTWQFSGKNWALYINYDLNASSYVGDLYAGNPKNDPASHVVGTVTVSDNVVGGVGDITVTYTITKAGWAIFNGHTIVRGRLADIPQAKGNPIPGQFGGEGFFGPFDPPEDQVTVTIPYNSAWGTNLFVGAHAIVGY